MKLILGAIALVVLVVLILRDRIDTTSPVRPSEVATTPVAASAPPIEQRVSFAEPERRTVLDVPSADMLSAVRAIRRVRPDRRVLLAVADIHRLLTGTPTSRVRLSWGDPNWIVEYGEPSVVVGTLRELASLEESRRFLTAWADAISRREAKSLSKGELEPIEARTVAALDSLSAPAAMFAIQRLDDEWATSRDARLLSLAASAFGTLAVMSDDQVDMSDALLGRALAVSVAARALGAPQRRAEVLIAQQLGYLAEARDSARALDATDAVRMFVLGQDKALIATAEENDADALARYFAIYRSGQNGQDAWYSAIQRFGMARRSSTATLKTAFVSRDFGLERSMPYNAPGAVTSELRALEAAKNLGARMSHRLRSFYGDAVGAGFTGARGNLAKASALVDLENQLGKTSSHFSGALIDSSVVDSYFRACYYSALARSATFFLERLSSVESSRRLAEDMAGELPSGPAPEYAAWLRHLADAKAGKRTKPDLLRDATSARWLGYRQLEMTIDEIERDGRFDQYTERLSASQSFAARLDGRPDHVHARAGLSTETIWDMVGGERFYTRAAAMKGDADESLLTWVARLVRDTTTLMRMAADTSASLSLRSQALGQLVQDSLAPNAFIRRQFEAVIAAQPEHWRRRSVYVDFLRGVGDFKAAESVAREWVEKYPGTATNSFDPNTARVTLARTLEDQKRYAEAWEVIQPTISSYQGNAMSRGVSVLLRTGRLVEASQLADEIVDRYPDGPLAYTTRALALWTQKRHVDAAKQLYDAREWINGYEWRSDVARAFLQALGDQPESETTAAFQALIAANVPHWMLGELANGLVRQKRPDLGFAFHSKLQPETGAGGFSFPIDATKAMRSWRGNAAATEWLRQYVPTGVEGPPAMAFYQYDLFDELWTLRMPGQHESTFTWLMRAAAATASPAIMRKHRDELLAVYQLRSSDPYFVMGRYLMGLTSKDQLLAIANAPDRRCEIAYYLGLRAKAEGRLYDAADWFAASIATGQRNEGEYIWSLQEINRFATAGKSLAAQAR